MQPDSETRRFTELHALAGILPYQRRGELSALLSDADAATLRHLVETDAGANTPRALASGLACRGRWRLAAAAPLSCRSPRLDRTKTTEAARQGVPLPEATAQSQHKSVQQAARYYNDAGRRLGKGARLTE